jgi:superfamily II DNA or RNA helicase
MLSGQRVQRLLLLSSTRSADWSWVPGIQVTDWGDLSELLITGVSPLVREPIHYQRGADEVQFLAKLSAWLAFELDERKGRLVRSNLLLRAASSIFTLEGSLLRLRGELLRSGSDAAGPADVNADDELEDANTDLNAGWLNPKRAAEGILDLLRLLESVQSDAKLGAVMRLLASIRSENRRVCVFTSFVATAEYVVAGSRKHGHSAYLLTGSMNSSERSELIGAFSTSTGILVAADAMLQGFDLRNVPRAIFYDEARTETIYQVRVSRLWRVGRQEPLRIYELIDNSRAFERDDG